MADLIFYTNPMSRGRIVRWMLEEVGQPYETEIMDYATTMKAPDTWPSIRWARCRRSTRRHGGHRRRGDLRLSRRRVSAGGPGAASTMKARDLLPLAVLRRGPGRTGYRQSPRRLGPCPRAGPNVRLRQL